MGKKMEKNTPKGGKGLKHPTLPTLPTFLLFPPPTSYSIHR